MIDLPGRSAAGDLESQQCPLVFARQPDTLLRKVFIWGFYSREVRKLSEHLRVSLQVHP